MQPLSLVLTVCLVALAAQATGRARAAESPAYVGVIDAGSSGSRLFLHRVDLQAERPRVADVLDLAATSEPLSSFADRPQEAGAAAIEPLLSALDAKLAERGLDKSRLRISVLATGGMRLLEPDKARAIEASARKAITDSGFAAGRVETISGAMEGFYAWLDVNALLRDLGPGRPTFGVIEIGGASAQVAYATDAATAPDVITARLMGQTYHVRSLSFLGLGADQARKSMMAAPGAESCYPAGLVSDKPELQNLHGAFDAAACEAAFLPIIRRQTDNIARDDMKSVKFIGLGRLLTGVLADWRLAADKTAGLRDTAQERCAAPYADLAKAYGTSPYTQYLCANSVYLATLLFHPAALGLDASQITAVDRIDDRRPSWTRGAALMLAAP